VLEERISSALLGGVTAVPRLVLVARVVVVPRPALLWWSVTQALLDGVTAVPRLALGCLIV
jgi:hypothetical protein